MGLTEINGPDMAGAVGSNSQVPVLQVRLCQQLL